RLLADKEKLQIVLDGIEQLSAEQKQTLLMYVEGEMSYDEIAEAMETKRETVKTRLRYARAHLKKLVFAED
ncbi:MAG: RNA polymerase sigma factor, partial [Alphaproteobacteria bacterium]